MGSQHLAGQWSCCVPSIQIRCVSILTGLVGTHCSMLLVLDVRLCSLTYVGKHRNCLGSLVPRDFRRGRKPSLSGAQTPEPPAWPDHNSVHASLWRLLSAPHPLPPAPSPQEGGGRAADLGLCCQGVFPISTTPFALWVVLPAPCRMQLDRPSGIPPPGGGGGSLIGLFLVSLFLPLSDAHENRLPSTTSRASVQSVQSRTVSARRRGQSWGYIPLRSPKRIGIRGQPQLFQMICVEREIRGSLVRPRASYWAAPLAPCEKKGAPLAPCPQPTISQNPGGGGGLGGVAYKDRARPPSRGLMTGIPESCLMIAQAAMLPHTLTWGNPSQTGRWAESQTFLEHPVTIAYHAPRWSNCQQPVPPKTRILDIIVPHTR